MYILILIFYEDHFLIIKQVSLSLYGIENILDLLSIRTLSGVKGYQAEIDTKCYIFSPILHKNWGLC